LLKPVERERLYGVMQQIEAELKEKLNVQKRETKSFVQSIRFILHNAGLSEKELHDFEHSYEKDFYQGAYRVICIPKHTVSIPQSTYEIEDTDRQRIIIVDEACYLALKAKTTSLYCGVSESFQGLRFLQQAYQQAFIARMEAYFQQTPWMVYSSGIVLGEKEGFEKEQDQFIQLLSISRTKDAIAIIKTLYELVECRTFNPKVFAQFTQGIVTKLPKTFQKVVEINQSLDDFYYPWSFDTAQQYLLLLIEWIEGFSLKLNEELDDYENKQKIQQALKYIHQHFASNLNMAVVSNHVEMNYTLFSQLFKQYTGKNFVKYLHELRLDESKKLLKETDLKIFEISSKVGFTDEKHYMKLFKSTCGISPSEYRKTLHLN
ncbi:MAG: helix-turn-helix domain-containing protein, partial [Tannerellaceae bacterium]